MSAAAARPAEPRHDRVCATCGAQLAARNGDREQRCYECQRAHRSSRRCGCGCGAPLGDRNKTGLTRGCFLRRAWAVVREKEQDDQVVNLAAPR